MKNGNDIMVGCGYKHMHVAETQKIRDHVAGKGLSAADLEKIPRITGRDLVLGSECAVCLGEIGSEQATRMVPGCNHGFHVECIDTWLAKNPVCPVCRVGFEPELFAVSRKDDLC